MTMPPQEGSSSNNSLLVSAERLLYVEKRPADAAHLTQILWQQSPAQHTMLHATCLMELGQYDAALHVLEMSAALVDPLAAHMVKMRCSFELGDNRACCASANAILNATNDVTLADDEGIDMMGGSINSDSLRGGAGTRRPSSHYNNNTGASPTAQQRSATGGSVPSLTMAVTALCYLGRCAEHLADADKAVGYYQQALALDPMCSAAMHALLDHRLLQPQDMLQLVLSLPLPPDAEALRQYYIDRVGIGNPQLTMPPKVDPWFEVEHSQHGSADSVVGLAAPNPKQNPTSTSNASVTHLVCLAAREHAHNRLHEAVRLAEEACRLAPFDKDALCVHLRILVDRRAAPALFEVAHRLTKHRGRAAIAVYAIGCYYFAQANYERAGRYFSRATELDPTFVEAWVAFGHCYAKLEEGEQALAVYRRALYLFPGLYPCAIFVGMQYSRIHSWKLAMCFLEDAQRMCPTDALVLNEIAVLCVRNNQLQHAQGFLQKALEQINIETCSEYYDCVLFNIATVYRRLGRYALAIQYFTAFVRCRPQAAHAYTALGFTYHISGDLTSAIAHYHTAMSIKPEVFCRDMLDRALAVEFGRGVGGGTWGGATSQPAPHSGGTHHHHTHAGSRYHVDPSPAAAFGGSMDPSNSNHHHHHAAAAAGPQRNRRHRSDSHQTHMTVDTAGPSPHASVGRSLNF